MSGFSFDFSALDQFSRDLEKIAQGIARNERAAVRAAGQAYQHDVQVLAPVDQGPYRASIRVEPGEDMGRPVSLIGTPAVQARQLEYGGIIRAKNGKYLKFKIDGHWVQVEQVIQHPHPHWRPPFDQNKEHYRDIMIGMLGGKPYSEGV
jgi:hypothetical protein